MTDFYIHDMIVWPTVFAVSSTIPQIHRKFKIKKSDYINLAGNSVNYGPWMRWFME